MAEPVNTTKAMLSNRTYDFLKNVVMFWAPAFAVLYTTLAATWELPYGFEVAATIAAFELFFAAVLGLSNRSYETSGAKYDGALVLDESGDVDLGGIELNEDPRDLGNGATLSLKLKKGPLSPEA